MPEPKPEPSAEHEVIKEASASESTAPEAPVQKKPVVIKKVEYVENVSVQDIQIASKIQHINAGAAENLETFHKRPLKEDSLGDFDYILKGAYQDDGLIGRPVQEPEAEVEEAAVKKRRRRRRR